MKLTQNPQYCKKTHPLHTRLGSSSLALIHQTLAVSPHLVNADGLAVYFDHVHNLDGIICIIFTHELYEPIALMLLGNAVPRHVYID